MNRTKIIQHYKDFFDLNEMGIGEDEQLLIDWAEALLQDVKPKSQAEIISKDEVLDKIQSNKWSIEEFENELRILGSNDRMDEWDDLMSEKKRLHGENNLLNNWLLPRFNNDEKRMDICDCEDGKYHTTKTNGNFCTICGIYCNPKQ